MLSPRDRHLRLGSRLGGRGPRRLARVAPGILAAIVALTSPAGNPAHAVPLDDPQVGGIGFSGPTTGDLGAVYWNPAALGLMRGVHVTFAGTGRLSTTTVSRAPLAGVGFGDVRASDRTQPFVWPPGPGAFAGVSYDVGGDRFTLAFATFMPFVDQSTYQTSAGEALATRYHRISSDLRNLAMVPALSVRFAGDFRVGVAPGVLFSTGRLSFAESTCTATGSCVGTEDPAADARADLGSDLGISSAKASLTLGVGLYFRRRAWEFGFSFSGRPFGEITAIILGDQSQITRPATAGPVTCDNGRTDGRGCFHADIVYKLPNMWTGAVAWHPRPGLEITAMGRILSFPANDIVDIRLTGPALAASGIPEHIVLYRGYGTVIDTRVRVASWIGERLRVGGGLRVESSAHPDSAVSPASVDGRKLEPTAMVLFRPARHLWLAAGYGFTYMFPVTSTTSVFDPGLAQACQTAGGDLGTPACVDRLAGKARPTAAGTYRHYEHDFSLSLTTQF